MGFSGGCTSFSGSFRSWKFGPRDLAPLLREDSARVSVLFGMVVLPAKSLPDESRALIGKWIVLLGN
jgi:hypothetical protein